VSEERVVYRGTVEFVGAKIGPNPEHDGPELVLDTQTVELSFDDRKTWLTAEWIGDPGPVRSCRVLAAEANLPRRRETRMFARVHGTPEIPVIYAGTLFIE